MAKKQESLEKYHKILFRNPSPIKKYLAFRAFNALEKNTDKQESTLGEFFDFIKYVFKELSYAKIYRIKSSRIWK
jgi:hypothetical protein